jgi:hypothetical protein
MTAKTPRPPVDDPRMVLEEAHAFAECARPFLVKVEDDNVNRIRQGELIASAANVGKAPPKRPRGHDLAILYEGLPADLRGNSKRASTRLTIAPGVEEEHSG